MLYKLKDSVHYECMTGYILVGLSEEATNINLIVFGLTRSGHEPTIYRTVGEHANHYTTDAVKKLMRL
jgi:hypothetical protein